MCCYSTLWNTQNLSNSSRCSIFVPPWKFMHTLHQSVYSVIQFRPSLLSSSQCSLKLIWHQRAYNTGCLNITIHTLSKKKWAMSAGNFFTKRVFFTAWDREWRRHVRMSLFRLLTGWSILGHRWHDFYSLVCFWRGWRRYGAVWQMSVGLQSCLTSRTCCGYWLALFVCSAKHCDLLTHTSTLWHYQLSLSSDIFTNPNNHSWCFKRYSLLNLSRLGQISQNRTYRITE